MKTLEIKNPVFVYPTYAYVSISDYYFKKLADKEGNLKVVVYKGEQIAGQGIVNKHKWIKTAKFIEPNVIKLRPEEPLTFYYNNLAFIKPETDDEKLERLYREGVLS